MNDDFMRRHLGRYYLPAPPYPGEMPDDLKPWHCYPAGAGHSVLCLMREYVKPEDIEDSLIPAPVRTVLRTGYRMLPTAIGPVPLVTGLEYDSEIGLVVPPEDDEF